MLSGHSVMLLVQWAGIANAAANHLYLGHDLSSLKMCEDAGSSYIDTSRNGQTGAAEDILQIGGMNTVRLRLWVNPRDFESQGSAYDLDYTLELAQRFHAKGLNLFLDLHFSDTWADPAKQFIPKKWPRETQALAETLRTYVATVLGHFQTAHVPIHILSLGNEIRNGMLWPVGKVQPSNPKTFRGLAILLRAARDGVDDAVRAGFTKPLVMIHIDDGWNKNLQISWFKGITADRIVSAQDWDVIGLSFYPFYSSKATFKNLAESMHSLASNYRKPIMIAETSFPAKCSGESGRFRPRLSEPKLPADVNGQIEWTRRVIELVKRVPNGLGRGVFYWEPAWTNNTSLGSACEDAILFQPDWSKWPRTFAYSRDSVNLFR